jgi:hypothetical protein
MPDQSPRSHRCRNVRLLYALFDACGCRDCQSGTMRMLFSHSDRTEFLRLIGIHPVRLQQYSY